jgi:predicted membrane-bound spermidine synthase
MNSSRRGIPLFFHPVMAFSGMGAGISLYVWFRMFTDLFGIQQVSLTSVLGTMLLCLGFGSRIWGTLADRVRNPLVLFAILQALAGLCALFNPVQFRWLQISLNMIIRDFHPTSFGMGGVRIVLTFLYLFVPLASMGGLNPVLGRQFIRFSDQAGKRISVVISMFSIGLMTGFFLTGFVLIPQFGMQNTLKFSSFISLFVFVLVLAYILIKRVKSTDDAMTLRESRSGYSPMMFRKRRIVLEAGAKLTRAMLRIHVLHGFTMVSLLIISIRLMYDYAAIGLSSLYLLILVVFFSGIALGSLLFRTFTARLVNGFLMMASLKILTGFSILFSYVLFTLIAPSVHQISLNASSWSETVACQILMVSSLLLIPAFITGIFLPLSARIYSRRIQKTGRSLGRLNFLYYTGILAGLLVTQYILLPIAGYYVSFLMLILISLLSGIYLLLRDSRLIRVFRLSYTMITLGCVTGVLFVLIRLGWIEPGAAARQESIRDWHEGSSVIASLIDRTPDQLALSVNGITNLETGKEGLCVQQLPALLPCILVHPVRSSLVIGFGMGFTASLLDYCQVPDLVISEVYPELITLSAQYFSEDNNDILTSGHVDINGEDARLFLVRDSNKYDLITSGYTDIHLLPGYFTREFYQACYNRLTAFGLMTQVLPLIGLDREEFRSLVSACTGIFPRVSLWYLSRDRILMLAGKEDHMAGYCSIAERYNELAGSDMMNKLGIPDPESLLGRRLMDDNQLKEFAEDSPVNENDRPYVEFSRTARQFRDPELISDLISRMKPAEVQYEPDRCGADKAKIALKIDRMHRTIKAELLSGENLKINSP